MAELLPPELRENDLVPDREPPQVVQQFVSRHRHFFLLLGVLILQLLLLSLQITRNQNMRLIQVWAVAVLDPFEKVLRLVTRGTVSAWEHYRGLRRAEEENRELKRQLAAAHFDLHRLASQAAETERLRDLLEFRGRTPYLTVAAEVIACSPGESTRAVFINKGSREGLAVDMAVITPEGIAGKVIQTFPHSAQVLLITDRDSGAGCYLESTRVHGVLKGTGSNLCRLHYVMDDVPVKVGDVLSTSGQDQIFPKGLPVGRVASVQPGNIYKNIEVRPAAQLDRLDSIMVILRPKTSEEQALSLPPSQVQ